MNTSNIVSLPGAADLTGKEHRVVKITSTGVNVCPSGSEALGTLLRAQPHQEDGVYAGKAVAVQLAPASIHFAVLGNTSAAIAVGDGLILDVSSPDNDGKLTPSESSPVARSLQAVTASDGSVISIYFL